MITNKESRPPWRGQTSQKPRANAHKVKTFEEKISGAWRRAIVPAVNIKAVAGFYWPLYVLGPVVGLMALVKAKPAFTSVLGLGFLCLFYVIPEILGTNGLSLLEVLKLAQIAGGMCFAFYGWRFVHVESYLKFICVGIALSIGLELLKGPYSYRDFFGLLEVPRYLGAYADGNISCQLYLQVFLLSLLFRNRSWPYVLFAVACVATTGSRSGFLQMLFFGGLALLKRHLSGKSVDRLYSLGMAAIMVVCFCQPFTQRMIFNSSDAFRDEELNEASTGRYAIHQSYYSLWLTRPVFGFGSEESIERSHEFFEHRTFFAGLGLEQHSIFYQVLSGYGLVGYTGFALFATLMFHRLPANGRILFAQLMVGFTSFSGFTSSLLWISLGVATAFCHENIAHKRTGRPDRRQHRSWKTDEVAARKWKGRTCSRLS